MARIKNFSRATRFSTRKKKKEKSFPAYLSIPGNSIATNITVFNLLLKAGGTETIYPKFRKRGGIPSVSLSLRAEKGGAVKIGRNCHDSGVHHVGPVTQFVRCTLACIRRLQRGPIELSPWKVRRVPAKPISQCTVTCFLLTHRACQ